MNVPSRLALAALVVYLCAVPLGASGAASGRVLAPTDGAVFRLGVRPTFVLEDRHDGMAILEVSRTRRTDTDGLFAAPAWSTGYQARREKTTISAPRSGLWKTPGTYYWHAYRIDCPLTGPGPHTCSQRLTTPTRRFRISRRHDVSGGYSSLRHMRGSAGGSLGVRCCRKAW